MPSAFDRAMAATVAAAMALSGCSRLGADAQSSPPSQPSRPRVSQRAEPDPHRGPAALASVRSPVAGAGTDAPTVVEVTVEDLWRERDLVRLAIRGRAVAGPDVFRSELIGDRGPTCGLRLFDLSRREVYPALRCSDIALSTRPDTPPFVADFAVPPEVRQVRVLLGRGSDVGPLPIGDAPRLEIPPARTDGRIPPPRQLVSVAQQPGGLRKVDGGGRTELAIPSDVLFAKDSHQLDPGARQVIRDVAQRLAPLPPSTTVQVIGHTDDDGTDAYNDTLARDRAEAVRAALMAELGGGGPTLVAEGRGEREPVVPNRDAGGRAIPANQALNRRVTLAVPEGIELPPRYETVSGRLVLPDVQPTEDGVTPAGSLAVATAGWNDDPDLRYRLDVIRVRRAEGAIGVSLALQLLAGRNDSRWGSLFSHIERTGGRIVLADLDLDAMSVRGLRLVLPDQLVSPFTDEGGVVLGSVDFYTHIAVGHPLELVAWFPDPDPTATTIDLMVPSFGTFRGLPVATDR